MPTELAALERTDITACQADNEAQVVQMWLHGRSQATQRAYGADAQRLQAFAQKPLTMITLQDLQHFSDSLGELSPASTARVLSSVKSLFSFAHRLGYLQFNPAAVLRLPKLKNTLAERIISEKQTLRMVGERHDEETGQDRRDRMIVTLLYAAGLRVSELCALCWRDAQPRGEGEGGQITVFGKGGKTRVVRLPATVWSELAEMRGEAGDNAPVFVSRKRNAAGQSRGLDQSAVNRIVHGAAQRAGIKAEVSPHWLRHAHASHAIDRGAPISLVQTTLGHASVATTGRYLHARPSESSSRFLAL